MKRIWLLNAIVGAILVLVVSVDDSRGQNWSTNIGHDVLAEELGGQLFDGTGVVVCQVEAPVSGGYKANPNDSDFLNPAKNFVDLSGFNNVVSGHANTVGTFFYSNTGSAASGVSDVFQYEVNDWLNVATGFATGGSPLPQSFAVQNHSWVANGVAVAIVEQVTARVDYMAMENDMNIVVGTSNSNTLPQLMLQGYNTISVGRRDAGHGSGLTQFLGAGRVKPEIVNRGSATSWTTARVSSAVGFMREAAAGTHADNNEQIKSLILGGATKVEFADWDRSDDRPLDTVFGVGELNLYNSYKMLAAGETDGQTMIPENPTGHLGWDHGTIQQGQMMHYSIELEQPADHLCILLTWNADVIDTNPGSAFVPQVTVSDMDLMLTGKLVSDLSVSDEHNIEHIYVRDVPAGVYIITVTSDRADDFSLCWRAALQNEATPTSINVSDGKKLGGSILSTLDQDGDYFSIRPSVNQLEATYTASVEFESLTPVSMENAIEFQMVASVGTSNIEQEIMLYNFSEDAYETFDQSSASFGDVEFSAYVYGELYDFVDPATGTMRAKINWKQNGPVFQSPWTIRIDKASFVVSQ